MGIKNYSTILEEMDEDVKQFSIESQYPNYQKYTFTSPITSQYNKMMNLDIREKNYKGAIKSYQTMIDFGGEPNVYTKNLLLSCYTKLRQHKTAEKLFEEMQQKDETDIVSFNIILGMRSLKLDVNLLRQTWEQLKLKFKPDEVSYLTFLRACEKLELVKDAEQKFSEMTEGPSMKCISSMLRLYIKVRYYDKALQLIEEINEKGIPWNIGFINSLIKMYGDTEQFDEIENLINTVDKLGLKPDMMFYYEIINAYSSHGDFDYVNHLLKTLKSMGMLISKDILHKLMYYHGKNHNWQEVQNCLDLYQIQNFRTNIKTFDALMRGRLEAGHPNKALRYFQEAEIFGLDPSSDSYSLAIRALVETNKYETAVKLWEKCKNDVFGCAELYLWASIALLRNGNKVEAKKPLLMAHKCPSFTTHETIQFIIDSFGDDLDLLKSTLEYSEEYPHIIQPAQSVRIKELIDLLKK
eukprot:TRINITY_DN4392_c0_g1_i2.p1 TRINITY_DN4392_c0_g1~~TRINITY_DN4392_c0_g1_i2.p1  ORF type:complete len:520 (+),score=97.19 TRINITY_DN4392_c0_g1_i2:160-1560(+)